jgi:integrase
MALNSGMRRGEILSLKWKDPRVGDVVDIGNGIVNVLDTKSGEPRKVDMNATLFELLRRQRLENPSGGDQGTPLPRSAPLVRQPLDRSGGRHYHGARPSRPFIGEAHGALHAF